MPRVIHFELHAEQPERAIRFYTQVFGWTFHKWDGPLEYWTIATGPEHEQGINGGMIQRVGANPVAGQPVNAYVCTVEVTSVDEFVARSLEAGGTPAAPKFPIAGIGWMAYIQDTEGNLLGLIEKERTVDRAQWTGRE